MFVNRGLVMTERHTWGDEHVHAVVMVEQHVLWLQGVGDCACEKRGDEHARWPAVGGAMWWWIGWRFWRRV